MTADSVPGDLVPGVMTEYLTPEWGLFVRSHATLAKFQKWDLRRRARSNGGWVSKLPKVASGWTQIRDMPAPAARSFHQVWKDRERT